MKRVVHLIVGLRRGGAERALNRLVHAQRGSSEYEHIVISLTDLGCYGEPLRESGVDVYALGMNGVFGLPVAMIRLVKLLRFLKPDILQTWMYHADLIGGIAASFVGKVPVLWGIRSFELKRSSKLPTRIVQKICALMSNKLPTLILCVAEASKRNHVALGYNEGKIRVIPNGFESSPPDISVLDVRSFRSLRGVGPDDIVIGCVGRFHPAKDHRNFVMAAALLVQTHPFVRFMMVGLGLDWDNEELVCWIDSYGIRNSFILLGERSDVSLCMSAMDIFCSSSRTEAFPQVVGEAMLIGRPCVVTDVGDSAFVVGDTGVVVERENARALAEGLVHVLQMSPSDRVARGLLARDRICREFSLNRTIQLTLNAYEFALIASNKLKDGV